MSTATRATRGYTLLEVMAVLGIIGGLAVSGWPVMTHLLTSAQLSTAAETIRSDIRRMQREARVSGQMVVMQIDPGAGRYTIGSLDKPSRRSSLPSGLAFASPDGSDPDGVTFRDNTVRVSPRPGLQSSVGSITVQSRGGARRLTISITGHVSIKTWDGRQWR